MVYQLLVGIFLCPENVNLKDKTEHERDDYYFFTDEGVGTLSQIIFC